MTNQPTEAMNLIEAVATAAQEAIDKLAADEPGAHEHAVALMARGAKLLLAAELGTESARVDVSLKQGGETVELTSAVVPAWTTLASADADRHDH